MLSRAHWLHNNVYKNISRTSSDINPVRDQPPPKNGARGHKIVTINVTSWNSKIYRYIKSLDYDVIFVQEHRKTRRQHIKLPKEYCMQFSPANVTGTRKNEGI